MLIGKIYATAIIQKITKINNNNNPVKKKWLRSTNIYLYFLFLIFFCLFFQSFATLHHLHIFPSGQLFPSPYTFHPHQYSPPLPFPSHAHTHTTYLTHFSSPTHIHTLHKCTSHTHPPSLPNINAPHTHILHLYLTHISPQYTHTLHTRTLHAPSPHFTWHTFRPNVHIHPLPPYLTHLCRLTHSLHTPKHTLLSSPIPGTLDPANTRQV